MDDWVLVLLITLEMAFDGIIVTWIAARLAGPRAKEALVTWMSSEESIPYMDAIATRAMLQIRPEITRVESKISRIETDLSDRMSNLRMDVQTVISGQRSGIVADLNRMTAKFENQIAEMTAVIEERIDDIKIPDLPAFEVPPLDLNPLLAEIQKITIDQMAIMKAEMIETMRRQQMAIQSAANRALQGQLANVDEMVDQYGEAIMEESVARGNPSDMILAQIMATGVSKKYEKEHPAAAMILKMGKASAVQAIQSGAIPGLAPVGLNNQPINNGATITKVKTSPFD